MMRFMGALTVIPASVLLTISFFVLLVIRKLEAGALKAFAYVVVAFLWLAVAVALSVGAYSLSKGCCPMMHMKHDMMKGNMQGMMMDKAQVQGQEAMKRK